MCYKQNIGNKPKKESPHPGYNDKLPRIEGRLKSARGGGCVMVRAIMNNDTEKVFECFLLAAHQHCKNWNTITLLCGNRALRFDVSDISYDNIVRSVDYGRLRCTFDGPRLKVLILNEEILSFKVVAVQKRGNTLILSAPGEWSCYPAPRMWKEEEGQ